MEVSQAYYIVVKCVGVLCVCVCVCVRFLFYFYFYIYIYVFFPGQRPFGVSFLFAGWDRHFGFQLYHSDPSGNFAGWKATAIGKNNQVVIDDLLSHEILSLCGKEGLV